MTPGKVDPLVQAHWEHIQDLARQIAQTTLLLPEFRDAPPNYVVSRVEPYLLEQIYAQMIAEARWDPAKGRYKRKPIPPYLRRLVYTRDGYLCTSCGHAGTPRNPLTCDHVKPVVKGGLTILENLATMCRDCNMNKGAEYDDGINS